MSRSRSRARSLAFAGVYESAASCTPSPARVPERRRFCRAARRSRCAPRRRHCSWPSTRRCPPERAWALPRRDERRERPHRGRGAKPLADSHRPRCSVRERNAPREERAWRRHDARLERLFRATTPDAIVPLGSASEDAADLASAFELHGRQLRSRNASSFRAIPAERRVRSAPPARFAEALQAC